MSDLAAGLIARLEGRRATGEVASAADAPGAAAALLAGWGTRRALVPDDPWLRDLGLPDALAEAGCEVVAWGEGGRLGRRELLGLEGPVETCGVVVPLLGVAERGTLVLGSSPGHGRSLDAASMRSLAVLPAGRVRATLGEALAEVYAGEGLPPSAVSLVSAPSRTSDIEKISTLGAHGALSLHVLVVEGDGGAGAP